MPDGPGPEEGVQARVRARQQAAVARLGQHALAGATLSDLLDECAAYAAREMSADYSKVLQLLPGGEQLLMRAGVGWGEGYIGYSTVEAGTGSQAGFTLLSREPVILEDASSEQRFRLASIHRSHQIISGITVVIPGRSGPFGILGVYTSERRIFSEDDINFLQSMANVLAAAIDRKRSDDERDRLVAEMKELAETARMRAAELQGVLDNMVDGVFVTDQQHRALLVNPAGARMLGLRGTPGPGHLQPFLRIRRPDGTSYGSDHPLLRALNGETVTLEEVSVSGFNGEGRLYVRVNAVPIRDDDGEVIAAVAVVRDITSMVELEKLKEQFISMAAHELKTPVAVMKGYAQALLKMGEAIPPPGRKMLAAIDRGSVRIDRIVTDLLDVSRFHAGRLSLSREPVDLGLLTSVVAHRVAPIGGRHRVLVRADPNLVVMADRARLEQVVANLLDNAIKYSPRGGEVQLLVKSDGDDAVLSVVDHGVGIPAEKHARVFERFFRAHAGTPDDYGGMGVGLYICKEIVSRLGGRIWFESDHESGSIFHFSLPIARSDSGKG